MNIQKFTQKSMEAVSACEKLAYDYGNQEIEQEHLLNNKMRSRREKCEHLFPALFRAHPAGDFLYNRKCNFLLYKKTTT